MNAKQKILAIIKSIKNNRVAKEMKKLMASGSSWKSDSEHISTKHLKQTSDAVGLPYTPAGMAQIADKKFHDR